MENLYGYSKKTIVPQEIIEIPRISDEVSRLKSNTPLWIKTRIIPASIAIADIPFPKRAFLTLLSKKIPNSTKPINTALITK